MVSNNFVNCYYNTCAVCDQKPHHIFVLMRMSKFILDNQYGFEKLKKYICRSLGKNCISSQIIINRKV